MIGIHFRRAILLLVLTLGSLLPAQSQPAKAATQGTTPAGTAEPTAKTSPAGKTAAGEKAQNDMAAGDIAAIKKPPLPEFHPQQPKRIQLENGMVIFLQEDHELPLIDGTLYVRGGSNDEPGDKVGLVSVYANAWRTGGTKTKTGDQLDDLLEARAARVESGPNPTATSLGFSCLKADFDAVLDIFNDVLQNPEFRQEKIDLARDAMKASIARRNDNIGQIAGREAARLGFGAQSPYARVPEYATVNAVTREDLLNWHSRHVHPNNIIFGIVGDFDSAQMEARLRKLFESWPKGPQVTSKEAPVSDPRPGMYFVEKEDVNQSEIRMVSLGFRRDNPDYYAVEVMNQVFGGGFSSRLFSNLRTKAGLAYAVFGSVGSNFTHVGLTTLGIGTRSGATAQAVEGLYREVDNMRSNAATPAELQRARDAILNSFVFEYDSKEKVMLQRMQYELYGYPADFLERFQKGVEKVTAADVDRVAKKYLNKDKLAVLVVGKSADFDKQLSTFGQVTPIDITIPQPGAGGSNAAASAPVTSNPEGKALIAKVIEASGGAAKLSAVKAVRLKASLTLKAQGISLDTEQTEVPPDKTHMKMSTPGGEMVIVASPQDSFMAMGAMGVRPLPASQKEDSINGMKRSIWSLAQHLNDPQYVFSAQGTEKVGDVNAAVLDIRAGQQQFRWYVDPKTGYVLREQSTATGQTGPETRVTDLSGYKAVDGITVPFHEEVSINGQPALSITVSSYEFNPTIDPKIFEKPAGSGEQK